MLERLKRIMDADPENEGTVIDYYRWWFRYAIPTRRKIAINTSSGPKNRIVDTWEIGKTKVFAVHTCHHNRKLWTLTHIPSGLALIRERESKIYVTTFLRFALETMPINWLAIKTEAQCPNTPKNIERFHSALMKTEKALSC